MLNIFNPIGMSFVVIRLLVSIIRVLPGPLAWVFRSFAYGVAWLVTRRVGRVVLVAGVALVLLDAAWGEDAVTLPGGTLLPLAVVGVIGAVAWRRRMQWEAGVEDAIYACVPGHSAGRPPRVRYGLSEHANTGRWLGRWDFVFHAPEKVRAKDVPEIEARLREQIPAERGSSWAFDWHLRGSTCAAQIVPDIPDAVVRAPTAPDSPAASLGLVVGGGPSPEPERVPLGVGLKGEVSWVLDSNVGNMFVAGGPGGGKSVVLNGVLRHCIEWSGAFEVVGIDLKGGVELGPIERFGVVRTVAADRDAALELLRETRQEVDRRLEELRRAGVKKISDLNEARAGRGEAPLRRLMILVDELAELTDIPEVAGKSPEEKEENQKRAECKMLLDSIVRLGRAAGVHAALALQRPDVRYMGGAMRSNIQARAITGRVDRAGSQMVESELAPSLPEEHPGRGVWWVGGREEIVQFYYTSEEELDRAAGMVEGLAS